MSTKSNSKKDKNNKNLRALFSVICLSIIALGFIVYFTTQSANDGTVNEATTIEDTTNVQRSVTVTETTTKKTDSKETTEEKETSKDEKENKETTTESTSMKQAETNTPYKSFYKYPIDEIILSGYTEELKYNKTMGDYRSHTAVDFCGEEGNDVVAINDGMVLDVYNSPLYGMTIEIDHGGKLVAKYCGFDSVNVKKGQAVAIGQKLGKLGKVPFESSEESHLHFETLVDGKYVNPLDVMSKSE